LVEVPSEIDITVLISAVCMKSNSTNKVPSVCPIKEVMSVFEAASLTLVTAAVVVGMNVVA
jgi:hypothetical protein